MATSNLKFSTYKLETKQSIPYFAKITEHIVLQQSFSVDRTFYLIIFSLV